LVLSKKKNNCENNFMISFEASVLGNDIKTGSFLMIWIFGNVPDILFSG